MTTRRQLSQEDKGARRVAELTLQQEVARLKELVIQLIKIIAKNAAEHE
ncbi:MAG: hypothetical protein Q7T81_14800 [Pseudolabrys sp.]|nr:hypothetical protein [Pseudolabrys sp.]